MKNLFLVAFASIFLLAGCKEYGTEGGNPSAPVNSDTSPVVSNVEKLIAVICAKRDTCTGQTDLRCSDEVLLQAVITQELRINPPHRNLTELRTAASDGLINEDASKFKVCSTAVEAIDCASTLAQQAFDVSTYEDIHLSLRSDNACSEIYTTQ